MRSLAAVMLLGAGLASCSQDDFADNRQGEPLPPGEYPLILNAGGLEAIATPVQQSAPTTRGTMESNWNGLDGQSVAVQVGSKVKKYRIVVDKGDSKKAKLEPVDENNTLYWENTADLTVKAWYPYKQIEEKIDLPTTWNAEKDFEDNDWLGAVNVMSFGNQTSHTLQFNHLLSKITVNLKESAYLSAYAQEKVTVTCSLSSNSFTFKGVEWNAENNAVGFITEDPALADVTPMSLDAPADGAFASFLCLANPNMESIDITVTVDGTEYKATELKPQEPFKPGHTYTFDITVKAEGLEVSVNDGIVWENGGATGNGSVEL